MSMQLKYQGRNNSKDYNGLVTTETYIGTYAEASSMVASSTINAYTEGKGYLTNVALSQADGPFWQVEKAYNTNVNTTAGSEGVVVGEKSATLGSNTIQMPIKKHPDYLNKWTQYLWTDKNYSGTQSEIDSHYASDVPSSTLPSGMYWTDDSTPPVEGSTLQYGPVKIGLECYDVSYYTVTELQKFSTATAAGNAIQKKLNKITSPSNTFGIGGNWKLDSVGVQYNGKWWIATQTYTNGNPTWDPDIYEQG